ncbi:MAG: hypothetical protein WC295_07360 [Methanoregula sp.]|jgi:hypothetical protein
MPNKHNDFELDERPDEPDDDYADSIVGGIRLTVPGPDRGVPSVSDNGAVIAGAPAASQPASSGQSGQPPSDIRTALVAVLSNPEQMANALSVTDDQINNLRTLVISAGTGAAHKYLRGLIGDVPASTLGAIVSSILARRLIRREE